MRFRPLGSAISLGVLCTAPLFASFIPCATTTNCPSSSTVSTSNGNFNSLAAATVQVWDPIAGTGTANVGTGTIIDARLSGNILQFGVVTAAHVVQGSSTGIYLGFSDGNGGVTQVTPDDLYVASGGGASADLSYIGVTYNLATNSELSGNSTLTNMLESITAAPIGLAPVNPTQAFDFTSYGYGLTAEVNPDSANSSTYPYVYDSANSSLGYGTLRTFTNSIHFYNSAFSIVDGSTTYTSAVQEFQLLNNGLGVSGPGDSGSGMFVNGVLEGVIEFGPGGQGFCYNGDCGYTGYQYGNLFGGVRITSSYLSWLQTQDASYVTAPEPATFVLAGLLIAGLALARKKQLVPAPAKSRGK